MQNSFLRLLLIATLLLSALVYAAYGQTPYRLTLKEAIQKGLQSNLRVLVAETQTQEAKGTGQRRLAALLPQLRAETLANRQTRNLEAFGVAPPGALSVIGPLPNYDYRVYINQPVLDLQNYYRWQASNKSEQAVGLDYQDARDLIIRQVAGLYLDAQVAAARVQAVGSRVTTAQALYRLSRDQRDAGAATGIDVLRAQVQLANEQQQLLQARNTAKQSLLSLARNLGLSMEVPIELDEPLEFKPVAQPEVSEAVASAMRNRPDYLSLQARLEALQEEEKSNWARYLPKLSFSSDYGGIGTKPGEVRGTWIVQGTLSVPLFDWDRSGERVELKSRIKRLEHQMDDLRLGIEQEIRNALLLLESASEEVSVATQGRELAERELELARFRFRAGVTDNIEVISAQQALARAHENKISALTRHIDSKAALARALGATEEIYEHYLGTQ